MENGNLIPHLFRTEYRKIIAVLSKLFGIDHIEIAEDIASDTFLTATEIWGLRGLPENPTAWLYSVAKNKAKDYLKHHSIFEQKIIENVRYSSDSKYEIEIDLSEKNITDSQLQMMFAICSPIISTEAQVGLSLKILCGFGIDEIANAFLTNKETIKKRLQRAKEKLRIEQVKIEFPNKSEINERLETVLTTLYLLFNEGYYSSSQDIVIQKDLCLEAMRLTNLLLENEQTNIQKVNALMALMCFQSSRFEARTNKNGDFILYHDQDESLWNTELIVKGEYFLNRASQGNIISKYHLEAGIAYWHTQKEDTKEKWENILQLYNKLLMLEYSPIIALNRTFALSKARGKPQAIIEAEKLKLLDNHLYHALLGNLYSDIDPEKAKSSLKKAILLTKSSTNRILLSKKMLDLK